MHRRDVLTSRWRPLRWAACPGWCSPRLTRSHASPLGQGLAAGRFEPGAPAPPGRPWAAAGQVVASTRAWQPPAATCGAAGCRLPVRRTRVAASADPGAGRGADPDQHRGRAQKVPLAQELDAAPQARARSPHASPPRPARPRPPAPSDAAARGPGCGTSTTTFSCGRAAPCAAQSRRAWAGTAGRRPASTRGPATASRCGTRRWCDGAHARRDCSKARRRGSEYFSASPARAACPKAQLCLGCQEFRPRPEPARSPSAAHPQKSPVHS